MKKVLIFNSVFTTAGISKIVSDYVNNISDDINVSIMTLKIIDDIYLNKKYKICTIGKTKNVFKRIYDEYKHMKTEKYDVIHINGVYYARLVECLAAKLAGVKKIIIHSHSSSIGSTSVQRLMHRILKKLYDYLATDYLACSDEAAKWMFSKKIYKNKKYEIINNGIDINLYKFNKEKRIELRKKLSCENDFVIGFIGRIEMAKNPMFIADILKESVLNNKNTKLLLIGKGTLYDNFMDKIKKYHLEDHIIHLDAVSNVYDYYSAMDVLILPSLFEGFGMVLIEAQTSGLPCIASTEVPKATKATDIIDFISLKSMPSIWAKRIRKITSISSRKSYIDEVKRHGYDIKDVVKELEKIYEK